MEEISAVQSCLRTLWGARRRRQYHKLVPLHAPSMSPRFAYRDPSVLCCFLVVFCASKCVFVHMYVCSSTYQSAQRPLPLPDVSRCGFCLEPWLAWALGMPPTPLNSTIFARTCFEELPTSATSPVGGSRTKAVQCVLDIESVAFRGIGISLLCSSCRSGVLPEVL